MSLLFRWSIYGDTSRHLVMLPFSVGTFQRVFGRDASYVVCADEPSKVKPLVDATVNVLPLVEHDSVLDVEGPAAWKKWCPRPRLAPRATECYVDCDVFLVGDPTELKRFCLEDHRNRFLVMQESQGSRYFVGNFGHRILRGLPPVNTGLLVQSPGADLSEELISELRWWREHIPVDKRSYHDEQGAISAILSRLFLIGQVDLLPQERYCILNGDKLRLTTLAGIAAVHATAGPYALNLFRAEIERFRSGDVG